MSEEVKIIQRIIEKIRNDEIKSVTIRKKKDTIVFNESREKQIASVSISE